MIPPLLPPFNLFLSNRKKKKNYTSHGFELNKATINKVLSSINLTTVNTEIYYSKLSAYRSYHSNNSVALFLSMIQSRNLVRSKTQSDIFGSVLTVARQ